MYVLVPSTVMQQTGLLSLMWLSTCITSFDGVFHLKITDKVE